MAIIILERKNIPRILNVEILVKNDVLVKK